MSGNFSIDYGLGLYGLLVPMEHPYKFSTMWFSQCLVYLRSSYLLPSYLRTIGAATTVVICSRATTGRSTKRGFGKYYFSRNSSQR